METAAFAAERHYGVAGLVFGTGGGGVTIGERELGLDILLILGQWEETYHWDVHPCCKGKLVEDKKSVQEYVILNYM